MLRRAPISKRVWLLILFGLLIFSTERAQASPEAPVTIQELKQRIETILSEHNVPGATIALVTEDRQIWADGIGYADLAKESRADTRTIFRWGSVSKSFVATSVLLLAERGLLSLEDRIADAVPDIEAHNRWEPSHPIRLVHCLEHTAAFDDLHFNECAVNDREISLYDALAINAKSRRARWKPGTYTSYSNVGPLIAAYAVQTATGRTFENFVAEEVFEVLGMETASFFYPADEGRMSTGYEDDGVTPVAYDHIAYRAAGSLNASAREMAFFVQMLLNRGAVDGIRVLTAPSVARMEIPTTSLAARAGVTLGYGLGNYSTIRDGFVFHGHDGMIAGFVASYAYNTELNRGYAVSINKASDEALKQVIEAVVEYLTTEAGVQAPFRQLETTQSALRLEGYYEAFTPMTELMHTLLLRFVNVRKIVFRDGSLHSGNFLFGKQRKLIPLSDNTYYREGGTETLTFLDNDGDLVICYGSLRGNFRKVAPTWVFLRFGAFVATLFLMVSSVLFAFVWLPRRLAGKNEGARHLKARVFTLLAVLCFLTTCIPLLAGLTAMEVDKAAVEKLGAVSIYSTGILFSSICFALLSFLGLFFSLIAFCRENHKGPYVHSMLVSFGNVIVVIYLWLENVIGITPWSHIA